MEESQPYNRTHEVNEEGRKASAILIKEGVLYLRRKKVYIHVKNRLEGNALAIIQGIIEASAS